MNILKIKKNYFITGRAATGIYSVLKSHFFNKRVLLPCNICYAAVYPIIFSGNIPVFCDVDAYSGNTTLDLIKKAPADISAMIIPHMFGNPVNDILEIKNYCKVNNILLIEDCASSMGATINSAQTGSFGDYVIYSTGYSKTIDLGFGGIICSDFDLTKVKNQLLMLPKLSNKIIDLNTAFSKNYRKYRNGEKTLEEFLLNNCQNLRNNFLFNINRKEKQQVENILFSLSSAIELRRKKLDFYNKLIKYNSLVMPYEFLIGAVPWRFNVLVSQKIRPILVKKLLNSNVPVSDWYPVVTDLFSDNKYYNGGTQFQKTILNFPLLCSDEKIKNFAFIFNNIVEEFL